MKSLLCLFSVSVIAFGQLSSEQAKAFQDYYFNSAGSDVVLADMQVCDSVAENECAGSVQNLEKGKTYMLWMSLVVPRDDKDQSIVIQYNHGGATMKEKTTKVSGSIRYRTWKGFTPTKSGEWEIAILHDKGEQQSVIEKMTVTVN